MLPSIKIGTCSREKKERGCAEVGYPANQEIEPPGLVDVFRFEGDIADEIARMIKGHEHHGEASNKVDGGYPSIATIGILKGRVLNRISPFQL
jgi:hypothetical protein